MTTRQQNKFDEIEIWASTNDLTLLSLTYVNKDSLLEWKCNLCDAVFKKSWTYISRGKTVPCLCQSNKTKAKDNRLAEFAQKAKDDGMTLKSTTYKSSVPLVFNCPKHGDFKRPAQLVDMYGIICRECAGKSTVRLTLEQVKIRARKLDITIMAKEYVNNSTDMQAYCNCCLRVWNTTAAKLSQRYGCQRCAGTLKKEIRDAQLLAEKHNGQCLSTEYINGRQKLAWECENKHEWKATYSDVARGTWCPNCAPNAPILLEECQRVAKERGGKCLSTEYVNSTLHMIWQCGKGHEFPARYMDVKHKNSWCPKCYTLERRGQTTRLTLKHYQEVAKIHGGECLATERPKNARTKVPWRCAKGHVWLAFYDNVNGVNKTWCPRCKCSKGEKKIRKFLTEYEISYVDQKTYPDLKDKKLLQYDFFLPDYNILIEFDGEQHFRPVDFYGGEEKFILQQKRDCMKNEYAAKNNINLIRIRFDEEVIPTLIERLRKIQPESFALSFLDIS